MKKTGKSGTLSADDFTALSGFAAVYGEKGVAQKIAKVCKNKAESYLHEFKGSAVGKAFDLTSSKISSSLAGAAPMVKSADFTVLASMVDNYGPELIVGKLAKIAKKSGKVETASSLSKIFPAA